MRYMDLVAYTTLVEALPWWKSRCDELLREPRKCYSHVYPYVSDISSIIAYLLVGGLVAFGIWVISTGHLKSGFTPPSSTYSSSNLVFRSLPPFIVGLLNIYWIQIDLWYRQLQPYMGLRLPSAATENLLLGYICDLPILITVKALVARHWRLALTSAMPLIHRALHILAGSMLTSVRIYF